MAFPFLQTRRKKARTWRILCVTVLFFAAWSLLAWCVARVLIVNAELAHADAIVVLAGSNAYVERTKQAARIFFEGRAPKILLTNDNLPGGWSSLEQRNPFFVERAAVELQRAGVPAEKIEVLPEAVSSTYDEAVLLRDYAQTQRLRSLLVVTSAYHSRRALWTFRRVFQESGIEIGLDTVAPGQQTPGPAVWWCQPNGWRVVALEYPKSIYYWVQYG